MRKSIIQRVVFSVRLLVLVAVRISWSVMGRNSVLQVCRILRFCGIHSSTSKQKAYLAGYLIGGNQFYALGQW